MRIVIAAVSHGAEISGVQRHALNLVRGLLTREEVRSVHVLVGPWQKVMQRALRDQRDGRLDPRVVDVGCGSMERNLWHYRRLGPLAAELGAEILHLSYPVPIDVGSATCGLVVTLHDLYPFEIPANFGWVKGQLNRFVLRQCLQAVDAIACVSASTQARLAQYLEREEHAKAGIVPNCVVAEEREVVPGALVELERQPFLLCVAQHRLNKNISLLLAAFACLRAEAWIDAETRLVVVGIEGPETGRISREVRAWGLDEHVQCVQGMSDAELTWCYRYAGALLAPSRTEGFGLPVVEALMHGCRVVCSDIPAFREVAGGCCRFVRLEDSDAPRRFAAAVASTLREPRPRAMRFPQFAAEVIGEQYVQLYRSVLEQRRVRCEAGHAAGHVLHRPERQSL